MRQGKLIVMEEYPLAVCTKEQIKPTPWSKQSFIVTSDNKLLSRAGSPSAAWDTAAINIINKTNQLNRSTKGNLSRMSLDFGALERQAGESMGLNPKMDDLYIELLRLRQKLGIPRHVDWRAD